MRIFFSVGEPSGDLHGSNLIRHLQKTDDSIEFVGYGGPKMAAAGCQLHFELTSLAVMFLAGALANLRTFFRLIADADRFFEEQKIDAVVLIDYPGFNWWIARKAKKHGIPVFYYGIPQVWAWAPWRVRKIRRLVDHVLCKLPFEVDWFETRNCRATYVGHPYFDQLDRQTYDQDLLDRLSEETGPILALLPGSRDQEVEGNLPILIKSAEKVTEQVAGLRVVVACYNERQYQQAQEIVKDSSLSADLYLERTPELMKAATVCMACSGSVSLELLYHRTPTVIVYRTRRWVIGAQAILLRTKFITLVNLIATSDIRKRSWLPYDPDAKNADPVLMPEYLTAGDPSLRMANWVTNWLLKPELLDVKIRELNQLADRVAKPGATEKAAEYLLQQLKPDLSGFESANPAGANTRHVA